MYDFGERLPRYFTMGTEAEGGLFDLGDGVRVGNAGVMLMNVEGAQ